MIRNKAELTEFCHTCRDHYHCTDALLMAIYQCHVAHVNVTCHEYFKLQNRMGSHKVQKVVIYTYFNDKISMTKAMAWAGSFGFQLLWAGPKPLLGHHITTCTTPPSSPTLVTHQQNTGPVFCVFLCLWKDVKALKDVKSCIFGKMAGVFSKMLLAFQRHSMLHKILILDQV